MQYETKLDFLKITLIGVAIAAASVALTPAGGAAVGVLILVTLKSVKD